MENNRFCNKILTNYCLLVSEIIRIKVIVITFTSTLSVECLIECISGGVVLTKTLLSVFLNSVDMSMKLNVLLMRAIMSTTSPNGL